MTNQEKSSGAAQLRVAIVGTGDIGRGWGALCAAKGWPVALYDPVAGQLEGASDEVIDRTRRLADLRHADSAIVDQGIERLEVARSLLQACGEADWVIESGPEDLRSKQQTFEQIESVAGKARAITSSSSALATKDIAARCLRQNRCLVAHPLNPPELIPLVELVPGPETDGALVELVKGWMRALGRIPVVIRKPIAGSVATRISAAVWRESIQLVLEGAIDVSDLDRAVSLGPALGWAAAGPHLTYHLAAGDRGVRSFVQQLLQTFEAMWGQLASWSQLDPEQQRRLTNAIGRAYEGQVDQLRSARDRRLAAILEALEQARAE